MRIIRDFSSCPSAAQGATVALGNFDGVHLGHQAILQCCIDTAKASGTPSAVMTFEPHPREFFGKNGDRLRIYSLRQKIELLREQGIDILYLLRFNARTAAISAQIFIDDILHRQLNVKHIVTGYNFAFGTKRQGNTELLAKEAAQLGFGFTACPPVQDPQGQTVSSSAIRTLLAAGEAPKAAKLLGRPYLIEGHVRSGEQRGRGLGYPTANLSLAHLFKPRFGIYAIRARLPDGTAHSGVASIGTKPTFGTFEPLLEAHLFDMHRDLYGQRIGIEFVEFIRDEKKFDSAEALKLQMDADSLMARKVLHG